MRYNILFAFLTASTVHGAIVTSGDFRTGSPTATFSITEPITFNITKTDVAVVMVLNDWVSDDGTHSFALFNGGFVFYQINGSQRGEFQMGYIDDNQASEILGDMDSNDGSISTLIPVIAGQTVTIFPGTFSISHPDQDFNPPPTVFTGSVFLASYFGERISDIVVVPEPGVSMLAPLSAIALVFRRKLKNSTVSR